MNLEELRKEIDRIDSELVDIFLKRMETVKGIAEYKIENRMEVLHRDRELVVIDRAVSRAPEEMKEYVRDFFEDVMKTSRKMQEDLIEKSKE